MSTVFSQVTIGGADRRDHVLRVELRRMLNSVGTWAATLRNINDVYRGILDVQDQFLIDINGIGNTLMQGRVDGQAVTRLGRDLESDWDEYVIVRGVDQAQDLLFHNDFDHYYPTTTQDLDDVVNDIINVQLAAATNITYTPIAGTPVIGAIEFREGASFLGTLQEMFRTAGYLFYVDDTLRLRCGAPGFSASGVILRSVAGDPTNNIINVVEIKERDGDKLYNYVKLYGKNPMFDGYTEFNASSWTFQVAGDDNQNNTRVGTYSQVAWNTNPVSLPLEHVLAAPVFNYNSWDFTKGEIGVWAYYDNVVGTPGTPGVGGAGTPLPLGIRLTDAGGGLADYFGASTTLDRGEWGWCSFPLGERSIVAAAGVADQWCIPLGSFDWSNVIEIIFSLPRVGAPGNLASHLYIDGITLPIPCIAVSQDAIVSQPAYRRRPYIDHFPNYRTQNAIQEHADRFLAQHKDTGIDEIRLVCEGKLGLRYAGQSVTIYVPALGLFNPVDPTSGLVCYMTEITHTIEPYVDVSEGYGFDWITEVTAIPINGAVYDLSRLRIGPPYSAMQSGSRAGIGVGIK
jgi:hypothetical protein